MKTAILAVLMICFFTLTWTTLNLIVSMLWTFSQPVRKMVNPQLSALLFFPLFIKRCKNNYYTTIGDLLDKK